MTMKDIHMQEDNAFVPDNTTGTVFIRIAVPELKNQVSVLLVFFVVVFFRAVSV